MSSFFHRLKSAIVDLGMGWRPFTEPGTPKGAGGQLPANLLSGLTEELADRYTITEEIGSGGMALVFRARDVKHDRDVALKILRPELTSQVGRERFLREIKLAARLTHAHILPLYDSGDAAGLLYYVMPFVEGGSLRDRLREGKQLSVDDALEITRAVASALDYAHRQEVVHRDIKPENILWHEGEAIVADFGIALALHSAGGERLTQTGLAMGTPAYMSPEQVGGDRGLDGRSDGYSLACVAYEMLAGEPPFTGPNAHAIMMRHVKDPVPPLSTVRPGLGPDVDRVMTKALSKTPIDRFSTATDFATALTSAVTEIDTPAPILTPGGLAASPISSPTELPPFKQEIHFCTAPDGVKIAYASAGEGPPLVKASNWLSHLEFDAQSPMWRHWWAGLSKHNRFIRYDERGCGLSDWKVEDQSLEAWVSDLESVVDAAELDRFALLGVSQGGPIAATYAVRHPEKVSHLILHGAYCRGKLARGLPESRHEEVRMELDMVRFGWGRENPAFRQVFTTTFFPGATSEQVQWFNELQKVTATPESAAKIMRAFHDIDVRDTATRVTAPTLVLHCDADATVPFAEGRLFASLIPGARLVPLQSKNHIPLEHEPAWHQFLDEIYTFLEVGG